MANGRQYHMNTDSRQHWMDDVLRRVAAEQQRNPEVLSRDFGDPRFANRPMQPAPVPQESYTGWLGDVIGRVKDFRLPEGPSIPGARTPLNPSGTLGGGVNMLKDMLISTGEDFGAEGAHKDTPIPMGKLAAAGLFPLKGISKVAKSLIGGADEVVTTGSRVGLDPKAVDDILAARTRSPKGPLDVEPQWGDDLLPRLPEETLAATEPVAQTSKFSELPALPGEGDEAAAKILGRDEFGSYKKPEPKLGDRDYVLKAGDPGYQPRLDPKGEVSVFEYTDGKISIPKKAFSKNVDDLTRSDVRKLIDFRDEAYSKLRRHSQGVKKMEYRDVDEAIDTIKRVEEALYEKGYLKNVTYRNQLNPNAVSLDDFAADIDDLVHLPGMKLGANTPRSLPLSTARPWAAKRNDLVRQLKEGAVSNRNIPGNQRMEGNPFWDNWQNMNTNPNVKKMVDEIVELEEKLIRSGWVDEASRTATSSDPSGWKVSIFD